MYSPLDEKDHFTHLGWDVFQPAEEPPVGPIRFVSLSQYYGKWKFTQRGNPLPGEDLSQYQKRPIQARLTLDSIAAFCSTLGLTPFTPSFYLPRSCVATMRGVTNCPVSRSLGEAQALFGLTSCQE
jgi:hypothetical protein